MHLIPQSAAHFHLLVSVFPSVGLIFILGIYVAGIVSNNETAKRTSLFLFVVLAVSGGPDLSQRRLFDGRTVAEYGAGLPRIDG